MYAFVGNNPLGFIDTSGKCKSVSDAERQADCLEQREAAIEQGISYLQGYQDRQQEAAFIATWNEDTGEVTVRVEDQAADRTADDVAFLDSDGSALIARPDGRIVRIDENGDQYDSNEIVLTTAHSHLSSGGVRDLDRSNESIRQNPIDRQLSRVAPAAIMSPTGRIRVFVDERRRR